MFLHHGQKQKKTKKMQPFGRGSYQAKPNLEGEFPDTQPPWSFSPIACYGVLSSTIGWCPGGIPGPGGVPVVFWWSGGVALLFSW